MNQIEFKKLIKKNKYQVFLFKTKVNGPFIFANHWYFVINEKGKISRWEIIKFQSSVRKPEKNYGNIFVNYLKAWEGFLINPFNPNGKRYSGHLISKIEGEFTRKLILFIKTSPNNYTFKNNYFLWPGPNSNTYTQWIINNNPECGFRLPWNAFGKKYANKLTKS